MNKYQYVHILQANYGYGDGWEDSGASLRYSEMYADLKAYRVNAPEYSYRIVKRRVLTEKYNAGEF